MEARIHISKVWGIMEQVDVMGKPKTFKFEYVKLNGELIFCNNATLSSIHSKGSTVNIITNGDSSPKSYRKILFTRINDLKIYL
jgi:hypothetical protein